MALHAPAQHAGTTGHHLLRDLLVATAIAVVLLVIIGVTQTVRFTIGPSSTMSEEQRSLIQYRVDERGDWAAGVPTQDSSLIEFRASEREGR